MANDKKISRIKVGFLKPVLWDHREGWDGEGGGSGWGTHVHLWDGEGGGSGLGTRVYLWLIHADEQQRPPRCCKVIILQLK